MSAAAVEQRTIALERANEIRSARSRILVALRTGKARIGDVDLTAPELASMRVIDFIANLRFNGNASSRFKAKARTKPRRLVSHMSVSEGRRLDQLSERQRAEMVRVVQERVELQRPSV